MVRKMQCSFGWDITPSFPSSGIYKPIFLEAFDRTSIQYVKFVTEKTEQNWEVCINVVIDSEADSGRLYRVAIDLANSTNLVMSGVHDVVAAASSLVIKASIPCEGAEAWWPNGLGRQPLYHLTASLLDLESGLKLSTKTVRVGFRTLTLEQPKISEVVGNPEAEGLAFYFKVKQKSYEEKLRSYYFSTYYPLLKY